MVVGLFFLIKFKSFNYKNYLETKKLEKDMG
jgi:hypothetical protein